MRYYLDTEFDGHGGPLLSIALVGEQDRGIHIRTQSAARDPWVQDNVMPVMAEHEAAVSLIHVQQDRVGAHLRDFIGSDQSPVIVADSPVDIGRFCAALSTASDGGWASSGYDRMTFEVHNIDCYPTTLPGAVQHNAWWDAVALRHALVGTEVAG